MKISYKSCLSIGLYIGIIIYSIYLFFLICTIHHVESISDLQDIIQLSQTSSFASESRCKQINQTMVQCLPNVFLIGASKCGTTSLVSYLKQLPNVHFLHRRIHSTSKHNEIHRFDRQSFALAWKSLDLLHEWATSPIIPQQTINQSLIIHYTPHYLYAPTVPYEMSSFYPPQMRSEMRFVVVLREPRSRAISSYWFKNSHLFQTNDQGNQSDLLAHFEQEKIWRSQYEQCMLPFLQQINQQYASYHHNHQQQSNHNYILWFKQLQQWNKTHNNPNNNQNNHKNNLNNLNSLNNSHNIDDSDPDNPYNYLYHLLYFYFSYHITSFSSDFFSNQEIVRQFQHQLQLCYGPLYRHKSLGYKHFDKSIYIDQLIRWFLYYPPLSSPSSSSNSSSQFIFLSSSYLLTQTKQSLLQLITLLLPNQTQSQSSFDYQYIINQLNLEIQLLKDPNRLSKQSMLSSEIIQLIDVYYQPYEYALTLLRDSLRLTWIE